MSGHTDFVDREIIRLIKGDGELEQFANDGYQHVCYGATTRMTPIEIYKALVLEVNTRPAEYPYIAIAHYDDERGTIRYTFVIPSMFNKE